MDALHCLRAEHAGILISLEILETVWKSMNKGKAVDLGHLRGIVEILTVLNHQCHEVKEEALLFPAMESAGVPRRGGVLDMMRLGHCAGRSIMLQMTRALDDVQDGDRDARVTFMEASRCYVAVLREHVAQEQNVVLPLAEKAIPEQHLESLVADFEKIDKDCLGEGRNEMFPRVIAELSRTYLQDLQEENRGLRSRNAGGWGW